MKKLMVVLGVAACATIVGCKNDEYGVHKVGNKEPKVEVVEVPSDTPVAAPVDQPVAAPADDVTPPAADPGLTSTPAPLETTPAAAPAKKDDAKKDDAKAAPADTKAAEPDVEFTPYVVRGGDTLGGIALRYKLKKADILKLNPGMDPNKIFVGRTIKLPGKVDVPAAPQKAAAPAKAPPAKDTSATAAKGTKATYVPYTGETKVYEVVSGDSIGKIAYSNGLTIRQFKELNGLTSDVIRVGQKVKIPAQKVVKSAGAAAAPSVAAQPVETKVADKKDDVKKVDASKADEIKPVDNGEAKVPAVDTTAKNKPAEAAGSALDKIAEGIDGAGKAIADGADEVAAAVDGAVDENVTTYVVKENDDIYSVAIKWGLTASQLKEMNNLDDDSLTPGQKLKVPASAE